MGFMGFIHLYTYTLINLYTYTHTSLRRAARRDQKTHMLYVSMLKRQYLDGFYTLIHLYLPLYGGLRVETTACAA
jgi:hypothetical protein